MNRLHGVVIGLSLVLCGACAVAQNTFPSSGNVGIGTTTPQAPLEVNGTAQVDAGTFTHTWTAPVPPGTYVNVMSLPAGSYGGSIRGTLSVFSTYAFAVSTATYSLNTMGSGLIGNVSMVSFGGYLGGNAPFSLIESGQTQLGGGSAMLNLYNSSTSTESVIYTLTLEGRAAVPTYYNSPTPVAGIPAGHTVVFGSFNAPLEAASANISGNVGIGTTSPGATLEVDGNIKLTTSSGASITFQDGTTQSTAFTGVVCGGDYAESVDVTGDRTRYEPGDVLVIDLGTEGNFLKSAVPYSTSVTGIYSTKPGVVGRRQLTDRSHMKDEVPMAMTGIVPTKVSAENGPIEPGDLLVTSSKIGYAMKGTNRSLMLGAVIGKALGHLDSGTGVMEVVVTLQ